jgi:hypothetical protein
MMPMIATTISSSISVKPLSFFIWLFIPFRLPPRAADEFAYPLTPTPRTGIPNPGLKKIR